MSGPSLTTVLGLDPGSRTAGYAFIRARIAEPRLPRDFVVLDAGVLRASESLPVSARIGLMHQAIYELMLEHRPQVVVLEKAFPAFRSNSTADAPSTTLEEHLLHPEAARRAVEQANQAQMVFYAGLGRQFDDRSGAIKNVAASFKSEMVVCRNEGEGNG